MGLVAKPCEVLEKDLVQDSGADSGLLVRSTAVGPNVLVAYMGGDQMGRYQGAL